MDKLTQLLLGFLLLDLDGTILRWQLFDELIREMIRLGLFPEIVYAKTKKERIAYLNRTGSFSVWVMKQVEAYAPYLKGVRVEDMKFAARNVIELKGSRVHVFTRSLSEAARQADLPQGIISGTPTPAVEAFAEAYAIDHCLGTEHEQVDGVYTGKTEKEWVYDKKEAVRHLLRRIILAAKPEATPEEIERLVARVLANSVAIGDSWGDRLMLELVRYPICFNPEDRLAELALDRQWPIVTEKKNRLHMYTSHPTDERLLLKLTPGDFLPPALASALKPILEKALHPKTDG